MPRDAIIDAMDDSYRSLLPLLRLRGENPEWLLSLLALAVAVSVGYAIVYSYRARCRRWRAFYEHGRKLGLLPAQIQLLERIAIRGRMRRPTLLLDSLQTFDRQTARYSSDETTEDIARIRWLLGFDQAEKEHPLLSTHQLDLGQSLMVWPVKGGPRGFMQYVIIDIDERAIHLAPLMHKDDKRMQAMSAGDLIKARYWREGDTEYRFRSRILDSAPDTSTIAIKHCDDLQRVQQRDFFRLGVYFELALHSLTDDGQPSTVSGVVVDISGGGLGFITATPVDLDTAFEIDRDFAGPFPLQEARCRSISRQKHPMGWRIRLEFIDLPSRQEDEIVRCIYQHQLDRIAA